MKTKIMIDLETFGTKPGSVIVSLGAVKFDDRKILEEFYERIDAESCTKLGLKINPATVMFWLTQPDEPRNEICKPGKPLQEVLLNFTQWVGTEDLEVWGNGATFDNVLLSCAYDVAGLNRPWKYSGDRCYRTVKNLYPEIEMEREGVLHNALDDARDQAKHLIKILREK